MEKPVNCDAVFPSCDVAATDDGEANWVIRGVPSELYRFHCSFMSAAPSASPVRSTSTAPPFAEAAGDVRCPAESKVTEPLASAFEGALVKSESGALIE